MQCARHHPPRRMPLQLVPLLIILASQPGQRLCVDRDAVAAILAAGALTIATPTAFMWDTPKDTAFSTSLVFPRVPSVQG